MILCICIQVVYYFILVPIMSEPTLYDIPLEVFRDFLLPDLVAKEVGSLTLVCRDLRDLCDDNEIWKILYSRTTKRVITDESVHAPKSSWAQCRVDTSDPVLYITGNHLHLHHQIRRDTAGCQIFRCWPKDLALFPSWEDWWTMDGRTLPEIVYHGTWHTPHGRWSVVQDQPRAEEYRQALREYWTEYNASKGLSTVNLCQCPSHYKESTLGFAEVKTRRKCYKKIVVHKLNTQKRKQLKSVEKKKERKVRRVSEVRKYLEKLEAELKELEITEERLTNATTHLQDATDAL